MYTRTHNIIVKLIPRRQAKLPFSRFAQLIRHIIYIYIYIYIRGSVRLVYGGSVHRLVICICMYTRTHNIIVTLIPRRQAKLPFSRFAQLIRHIIYIYQGISSTCLRGISSSTCLRGVSSSICLRGISSTCLRGISSTCLRGISSICLRGISSTCLRGINSTCLRGISSTCIRGISSTCLYGVSVRLVYGGSVRLVYGGSVRLVYGG